MAIRTHYDELGIAPDASPAAVRDAYRRLARRHHPDQAAANGTGSAAGGNNRMPQINEAYRVLSDPGRRAMYDASLRSGARVGPAAPPRSGSVDDDSPEAWAAAPPVRLPIPNFPWRTLVVFTVIAIVGVFVLAQFVEPGEEPAPDGILRNGDCVEVTRTNDAREVPCTGDGDLVVRQFIAFDRDCDARYLPYRDRQGMGIACVEAT